VQSGWFKPGKSNWLRSSVAGVALTAILVVASSGAEPDVAATQGADGAKTVTICIKSVKPDVPPEGGVLSYGLTRKDFQRIVETIPAIRKAIPVREIEQNVRYGDGLVDARLIGTTPQLAEIDTIRIARGRFLSDKDLRQRENVAVIGHALALQLFDRKDPIGKSIRIGENYFLVVGQIRQADATSTSADLDVYVPLSTMRSRMGDVTIYRRSGAIEAEKVELSRVEIVPDDPARAETVVGLIRRVLQDMHEQQDYSVEIVR